MAPAESDYDLAMRTEREAFIRDCSFYFLVGVQALNRPRQPSTTGIHDVITDVAERPSEESLEGERTHTRLPKMGPSSNSALLVSDEDERPLPQLFAVRKVQTMFESMVTVGRTQNNDIVIADVQVSRFHAFLKVYSDRVEIGDAGSRNGTFVGTTRLAPKGAVQIVIPGDRIRFAHLEFEFLEAGLAWDRVRALGV